MDRPDETVDAPAEPAPTRLRRRLAAGGLVVAPFVFDGFQARAAVDAGFTALYCTGFGTAAAHGLADVGLLGLREMVDNGRRIVQAAGGTVPVVCDADTGFGNAVNVVHAVREYAAAGLAALHLEDQVWPKRCGFMAGKEVIPLAEATQKVRAAVDASRALGAAGPVVIARTDALQPHGWDEVERRARSFHEAGAELLFVDGLRTRADAETCAERLAGLPLVYNGVLAAGVVEPLGFRLQLQSAPLLALLAAADGIYRELADTSRIAMDRGAVAGAFQRVNGLLGLDEVEELRRRYG
ncbi:MAG: isocitrate lyase/PEP mutase family protein [Acidimicrobiales bacterium]